ncbi:hypothetical protein KI387_041658, partial [Taxus chinensis]
SSPVQHNNNEGNVTLPRQEGLQLQRSMNKTMPQSSQAFEEKDQEALEELNNIDEGKDGDDGEEQEDEAERNTRDE